MSLPPGARDVRRVGGGDINEAYHVILSDGREIRCTPNHRIWTVNHGWVRADELSESDQIPSLDHATPAVMADQRLPVATDWKAYAIRGDWSRELTLPEKWDEDLGAGIRYKDSTRHLVQVEHWSYRRGLEKLVRDLTPRSTTRRAA